MNQNMTEKRRMLMDISVLDFTTTDLREYLDTHPDDVDAMNYFNHYNMEREKALNLYASQYTPLVLSNTEACNHWNWVTDPWPWEGGCK